MRRLVPNKTRRMIGAWCFLDHYGPDDIKTTGGMWVPPHPHTGLQTVTWLFEGLGLHTDSLGSHQLIRPGQLNVMTAGHGICHAEVSPDGRPRAAARRAAVGLPPRQRPGHARRPRSRTWPTCRPGPSAAPRLRVLVGSLAGEASTAPTYTPIVGAELTLEPGSEATLPLEPAFEYGVLVAQGAVEVDGVLVERNAMSYLGLGRRQLTFRASRGRRADDPDAARRRAVRGGDRDVVELHRPQPRGDRRAARGLERRRPRTTSRSGSARSRTSTATGCSRRRCRTPGSSRAAAPPDA